MPMSMTSQPLLARPRASARPVPGRTAAVASDHDTRLVACACRAADAWPMRSTIAGVSVLPTMPRMS